MQLEKQHRQALINELHKAKEVLELERKYLNKKEFENLKQVNEMSMFLAQERIKIIEQSLIDNEIDF